MPKLRQTPLVRIWRSVLVNDPCTPRSASTALATTQSVTTYYLWNYFFPFLPTVKKIHHMKINVPVSSEVDPCVIEVLIDIWMNLFLCVEFSKCHGDSHIKVKLFFCMHSDLKTYMYSGWWYIQNNCYLSKVIWS